VPTMEPVRRARRLSLSDVVLALSVGVCVATLVTGLVYLARLDQAAPDNPYDGFQYALGFPCLLVGEKTVRNYVSGIFTKLAVASRAEAVVRARDAGLGRE
jgi:hypothetical protein